MARKQREVKSVVLVNLDAADAIVDLGKAGEAVSLEVAIAAIDRAGHEGRSVWIVTKTPSPSPEVEAEASDAGESAP